MAQYPESIVSVLMGTHDETDKRRVAMAIRSILNQTWQGLEFIICDDGSERSFFLWLEKFCRQDSRIILLRNGKNRGLAATLNRCLRVSSGGYIARMDADDWSERERIEKQVRFLQRHGEYALVGCSARMIGNVGAWGIRWMEMEPSAESFLRTSPFIHPAVIFRREALEKVGGYSERRDVLRAEDYELFMRMYAAGFKGYNLQECLFRYFEDAQSFRRRKYRYRINECRVRYRGFQSLGILNARTVRYVVKPLLAGIVPPKMARAVRMKRFGHARYG